MKDTMLNAEVKALVESGAMKLPRKLLDWDVFSRLPLPKLRQGASLT